MWEGGRSGREGHERTWAVEGEVEYVLYFRHPAYFRQQRQKGGEEPLPLSVDEAELELLRQFDLAWQYGPCTGITRLQRWHRAEQMGLKPPPEVRQVLQSHPGDPRFQCSLWHFYPL
ncbi:DNA polymerase delta subunit 4 isoform X1 [Bubalus bubalis]|uniref:DNA polymerase delta subunit 4 isoform X1 n=1 Tax=Bubalus bubalis TaxID=89462 RepID=UPI001E1B751B|nr:DNA polymerase delta subunit 4 isoform X1 [Bubalus bubalis]